MPESVELTRETITDHYVEGESGRVFVIDRTRYVDPDGNVISESVHRRPIEPDAILDQEDERTRAIVDADRTVAARPPREPVTEPTPRSKSKAEPMTAAGSLD